jgi:hypothetical protein
MMLREIYIALAATVRAFGRRIGDRSRVAATV